MERLSYTDTNNDGSITAATEIVEESNYYPFGLKHKGYNYVTSSNGNSTAQKWGYQGQELSEDLGLNVHEWKYRVSDPAIGRFWQVDPLAEEYSWMTTYQFSSNQPIHAPELEGLESSLDLNTDRWARQFLSGKITEEEYKANHRAAGMGAVIGIAVVLDATVTRGAITKHLLKQLAVQTTFGVAEQIVTGESVDLGKAFKESIGAVDFFDASFDTLMSKIPGGNLMSKASEVLMPSMADITFEDGVQIGGVNKSYIDVAFDFSFSVAADNLKEYGLPNTKISGNPFIKSFKDGILDFGVDQTQKRIQDTNTGTPSSINPNGTRRKRNYRPDPRMILQKKDGTDVKLKHTKKI